MVQSLTFYAPTFIDESLTRRDRKGCQKPTGNLSGMVFTRRFSMDRRGRVKAVRGLVSFSWGEDTQAAKAAALAKVIDGMEELPELENNPPIGWVPSFIKEKLS